MKIRNRITIWVTLAGLCSTMLLSLVIILEKIETPYELLDGELSHHAQSVAAVLEYTSDVDERKSSLVPLSRPYWMRLFNSDKEIIFESQLVPSIDLPLKKSRECYTVETDILLIDLIPWDDDDDLAAFRMGVFPLSIKGMEYVLQIGRPLENIDKEIREQVHILVVGVILSFFLLVTVSYFVAGRILNPIITINSLVHEISEKTLGKRIPLADTRDEFYYLSESLNTMFDRLQYSFEKQKEFVANASHELKTPLAILRLSMEENLQYETLPESLQRNLVAHCNTLLRLNRLVENLLNLSALELSEGRDFKTFLLNSLISDVVEDFQPLICEKSIELIVQLEDEVSVSGAREQVQQVLINLLDNAIKYNDEGGKIRLTLRKHGDEAMVQVFNTGPGIPSEDQELVFDQFYRVEKSRAIALGGSGLGLTIVKKIIELHSGYIELKSKPGSWVQITFYLPLNHIV